MCAKFVHWCNLGLMHISFSKFAINAANYSDINEYQKFINHLEIYSTVLISKKKEGLIPSQRYLSCIVIALRLPILIKSFINHKQKT